MDPRPDYGQESYRGHERLAGRAALITGGDSGIGRAVATAFAREGADVLISYFDEDADADETVRVIEEAGRKCVPVAGDIQEQSHCRDLIHRAMDEFGRLDILLNNAAFQMTRNSIVEIPPDELDRTIKTNFYAMFYLCQAALPVMQPGSSIINTASIEAFTPIPQLLPYAATKAAIVNFTKALAKEAIQKGIRVNAVAPGPVWTPLIPYSFPAEHVASQGSSGPMQRPAQPAELAPVYVLLASPEASYITGEVYGVTGGEMPV